MATHRSPSARVARQREKIVLRGVAWRGVLFHRMTGRGMRRFGMACEAFSRYAKVWHGISWQGRRSMAGQA
eukprot:358777-Chlamydomonas_euryale.AAC.3